MAKKNTERKTTWELVAGVQRKEIDANIKNELSAICDDPLFIVGVYKIIRSFREEFTKSKNKKTYGKIRSEFISLEKKSMSLRKGLDKFTSVERDILWNINSRQPTPHDISFDSLTRELTNLQLLLSVASKHPIKNYLSRPMERMLNQNAPRNSIESLLRIFVAFGIPFTTYDDGKAARCLALVFRAAGKKTEDVTYWLKDAKKREKEIIETGRFRIMVFV